MAELNTAEELDDINELEYGTDALTGGQDKRMYLYYQLLNSLKRADSVDIVVSFLMESGVRMLLGELDNALKRGAKIRILTGNYLGITQPSALYLIKHKLGEQVDLRFYNEKKSISSNNSSSLTKTDKTRRFFFSSCRLNDRNCPITYMV